MDDVKNPVVSLAESECWERLSTQTLGRLVTRVGDVVDIFPVTFVVDGESIVFRTAEGSKLLELTVNEQVLFESDEFGADGAWSVIVRGRAHRIDASDEIEAADRLPLTPAVPTLKRNYVRITADQITGRAFALGEEPERDGVQPY
ncbi:pyridoxamine 5'-phosphate oxidase family protein [Microbacterium sp. gxy059]|uniref:pyridoxamine 5'-phosphate oxidase family protein n=1 Tax=Microbacterium sp. gxy059 TaxID=2957199 RepID=UPI003D95DD5A